jgi:MazG family protein
MSSTPATQTCLNSHNSPSTTAMNRLLAIMAQLRNPDGGCPWDLEQTFATIAPHTIEEAYEVVEAIEKGQRAALCDELGDLLLQVVFHSQIAAEEGSFTFQDVVAAITEKMIRRHPHVFGDQTIASAAEQVGAWEALKEQERAAKAHPDQPPSALDGVTSTLPSMTRAFKLQNRAARVGFDWDDAAAVVDKIEEELAEVKEEFHRLSTDPESTDALQSEIGDLLFTVVNMARKANIDPEAALRSTNRKFDWRFRAMEHLATSNGTPFDSLSLDQMEALWLQAKALEKEQKVRYTAPE